MSSHFRLRPVRRFLCLGLICLSLAGLSVGRLFAQAPPPPAVVTPQVAPTPAPVVPSRETLTNLTFDSETQVYHVKAGDTEGKYTFKLTNSTDIPVHIFAVTSGCSCTKAQVPRTPWIILPHTTEELHATMQVAGKPVGETVKTLTIGATNGVKTLWVKMIVPTPPVQSTMADRQKNQELAKIDRQSVFKNDCIQCHVTPAVGKSGKELYDNACGICHDSDHRATMITDLGSLNHPVDAEFWKLIITSGKAATMMPAFGQAEGGPLTKDQIDSLVTYLMTDFPRNHKPTPQVRPPEPVPSADQSPHVRIPPPRLDAPGQRQVVSLPDTSPEKK